MANILLVRRPNVLCSDHIRRLVVHACNVNHFTSSEAADTFLINKRTVDRILQRFGETGQINKKQQGGYKPKM